MASNTLSAVEAARQIAAGELSSEALVRSCLERIAHRESVVRAWSCVDPKKALAQACSRDQRPPAGPLHGIPVAVKDVIDAFDLPSGMGSPIYEGYQPVADAACVAAVRAAGAVILGKTVTAEFAATTPGPTTNPLDPTRTPGGSSSGSAAAVADFMVPVAFGTQTGGSILRPASFCGVIGFKPSFGLVNRAGLKSAAESLDTIGLIGREIDDITLFWNVLVGRPAASPPLVAPQHNRRLVLFRTHHWHKAGSASAQAITSTLKRLAASGAQIEELAVPDGFEALSVARKVINDYERARALDWEWHHRRNQISGALSASLANGWSISFEDYLKARRMVETWRAWLEGAMAGYDAIVTAAVNGEAPEGLDSTGDSSFQEIWTLLHTPSITLPLHSGPTGLPVGVQFVGHRFGDDALLGLARWIMTVARTYELALVN